MRSQLTDYVLKNEDVLMDKILSYARQREYTRYTSTLKEAWRLSVSGLSDSLIRAIDSKGDQMELGPDENYTRDPASQFGIIEAKRHRQRGIRLDMFLGLMKYYRQSYSDLIRESDFDPDMKFQCRQLVKRFFDRVEIGFCTEWSSTKEDTKIKELQKNNRDMTNEKNRYLIIFESLSLPVFIVDIHENIVDMNHAASRLIDSSAVPGSQYYGEKNAGKLVFTDTFPWMKTVFKAFIKNNENQKTFEKAITDTDKYFFISLSRSLDISGRFSDTIVIIEDITKRKILEKELEKLATTDPLTGSKNRRSFLNAFEQELKRSKRYDHNFALLMMDIDNFKAINDTHGHDMGDKVLKVVVAESFSVLRGSDIFGRWGGEEFILLLPETTLEKASAAAERLRGTLAKSELATDKGTFIHFTVSIGFTLVKDKNVLMDDIIKKADDALYLAKKQGKNRVVLL